jgi:hypothetical protein
LRAFSTRRLCRCVGITGSAPEPNSATIDLRVTVDFECGYNGDDDDGLAGNVARQLDLGINFEDGVVKGSGLYDVSRQTARIATVQGEMLSPRWITLNRGVTAEPLLGHQNAHRSRAAGSFIGQLRHVIELS